MSDMQFRAVRNRSNKSESEKATDSESVVRFRKASRTESLPANVGAKGFRKFDVDHFFGLHSRQVRQDFISNRNS
jgi:hypothetical protein